MIERVLIAGLDVDLEDVLASVTIRHGRGSVDDGPLASTANVTLLGMTRDRIQAFSAGDELELLLADSEPRFRGRITDAKLDDEGLEVIAVSSLSRIAGRTIGLADWPEESWAARVLRVFTEAGTLLSWQEVGDAFEDVGETWLELGLAGRLTFDHLDDGPMIEARLASETTLGVYLSGDFGQSEPAAVASLPDGSILVQQLSVRASKPELELEPDVVAWAPSFEQTDEVENDVTLEWEGGETTARAPTSIARFEWHPSKIGTELAESADAAALVGLRVARRAFPRWQATPIELLELEPAVAIGAPLRLHELPEWAPASAYLGIVEGWEDKLEPNPDAPGGFDWTMAVHVSDPRLSGGFGILWFIVTDAWDEAGSATWTDPDTLE